METLKKYFPFSFKAKADVAALVINIIIHIVVGVVIGVVLGLLGIIPIIGILTGIIGTAFACRKKFRK
jgi:hypothetical protein